VSELRELYQEVILDHGKNPRNFRDAGPGERTAHGHNPLCGDTIDVHVATEDGVITGVAFQGEGCAISTASASMMTQSLKGKTVEEAERLFRSFHDLLTGEGEPGDALGKLEVFAGVREFPVRVKCATLAWHTFKAALDRSDQPASTE
jgi:nitrogen fixation NifU-like protein